jgi:superfamily II DNA or RNA helicase
MADYIDAGGANIGYTATPMDIGHLYDELIVAGTPSELRKIGALVPVIMYGPDEPDLVHIKNYQIGDDLTEKQNVSAMMRPGIYGRVIDHYRRLNPEQLPSVGFAPGVKYSIGFAEKFNEAGIRAAHIDGDDVWLDGEFHPSSPEMRDMVMALSKSGEIKIIWNRYVLRVGVDAPWLCHGILACVFGSLTSYLQTAGRLARAFNGKTHATLQDHGGNYWRHGSVNSDREWNLNLTNRIVCGDRIENLREKKEQEPIVCLNCGMIRRSGKECPGCGYIAHAKSRMVVQINGNLKAVGGDILKERVVKSKPNTPKVWERYHYSQKRAGHTFRQAYAWFWHEEHYWPPKNLPLMPKDSRDWGRKISDVPRESLY